MSLDALLAATKVLHQSTPELSDFAPWPTDLKAADRPVRAIPAIDLIRDLPADGPLVAELQAAADQCAWIQTYSAEQIGQDFVNRYGYIEIFGPTGQFHSEQLRGYIAFWGEGLDYGWHNHEAEEIYLSLLGAPEFRSRSKPTTILKPGSTRYHVPWEIHGMRTLSTPFFCYALWKGPGLADQAVLQE